MAWVPMESNPEVMNKFLHKIGVPKQVQVCDVYSLDPDMLAIVPQPTVALLLLFPCDDEYEVHKVKQREEITEKGQVVSSKLFFVKQVVHNACGTIALIHSIANCEGLQLNNGFLKEFLDASIPLNPNQRGDMLQKAEGIINTHKEIANEGQTAPPDENEPVPYHFIAFVEKEGCLYELDGSKAFPINHGASSKETFLSDAAGACRQYMSRNPENVNFTVIAVTME